MASVTTARCHYDGGYRQGVFAVVGLSWFGVHGGAPDEPDALWTRTVTGTTFVDHAAWVAVCPMYLVFPNGAGKQLRMDTIFEDNFISDSVCLGTNSRLDGVYLFIWPNRGVFRASRSVFERSGNRNPAAVGTGGTQLTSPPSSASVSSVFDSEQV